MVKNRYKVWGGGVTKVMMMMIMIIIIIIIIIYPSGFITAVAVFRKPNAIPLCFSIDLFLNFLLSWLLVLLPSINIAHMVRKNKNDTSNNWGN